MKTKLIFFKVMLFCCAVNAQVYTPSGIIHGSSGNDNVGIGTGNPMAKLQVDNGNILVRNFANIDNQSSIMIAHSINITTYDTFGTSMRTITESAGNNTYGMQFFTQGSYGTGQTEKLRILGNGNVGIGTFQPQAKLHVQGDLQNDGNILLGHVGETNYLTSREVDQQLGIRGSKSIMFGTYNDGWKDRMIVSNIGNVGIGVSTPANKLDVNGTIHSKEVKVDMTGWSDFVFKKEYRLPTLEEVQKHITEKGHLENIPSEEEVLKNGISLGEMNAKLLRKIEELTLYVLEMKKENQEIKNEYLKQNQEIKLLKSNISSK